MNDGISEELCSFSYASLNDAVGLIRSLGPRTQLVKLDLKDTYRMVPVHPHDLHLLAVLWSDRVSADFCLPVGFARRQRCVLRWLIPLHGLSTAGT